MIRILALAIIGAVPGWPLREGLYRLFFGYRFGKGARISMLSIVDAKKLVMAEGAKIRGVGNMIISLHELDMGPYATIGGPRFGGNRVRGTANKPSYPHAALRLGPCAIVELDHYFDVCADIDLGANVVVGGLGTVFLTHTFHRPDFEPIQVGRDVFIGSNCRFQMGTSIADGCVVGMGAVVVQPMTTSGALLGGVPAKVISDDAEYEAAAAFKLRRRPYFDGERIVQPPTQQG